MNKEIPYIVQGFLLFVVLAIAFWFFTVASSVKPPSPSGSIDDNPQRDQLVTVKNVAGEKLFRNNCASCHGINQKIAGPALAGVEDRITDKKLIYAWIRNGPQVLSSGNEYFTTLFVQYDKKAMPAFAHLSNEDINAILEYIKEIGSREAEVL